MPKIDRLVRQCSHFEHAHTSRALPELQRFYCSSIFNCGIGDWPFFSVDLEHQIIPDEISVGGLGIGILFSAIVPSLHGETIWWRSLVDSLRGALIGGAIIYLTGVIGTFIFRKDAMGGGDVKLLAMLGAFLGWQKVILVYLLAPVLALPLGLFLKFVKRAEVIPFGPFLSLAGWLSFFWGNQFIVWYWNWTRF